MIYKRIPVAKRAGEEPTYRVAEIIIPRHEFDIAWRGVTVAMREGFGGDTETIDRGAIAQQGIETARNRLFGGVAFRGNVYVVDTIAQMLDEGGARDRKHWDDDVRHTAHDMTAEAFEQYAARPTEYFDALFIDVSPFGEPRTVMPPNASTVHRLTGETIRPNYDAIAPIQ